MDWVLIPLIYQNLVDQSRLSHLKMEESTLLVFYRANSVVDSDSNGYIRDLQIVLSVL